jgi:UDP-N-acetylglucosamine 4,6-dehydratase/5-epimerase
MRILITGGTGTLGKEITRQLLSQPLVKRIVIYSRDEFKQHTMQNIPEFDPDVTDDRIRWFVGDVRDEARLLQALNKCDHVIHAAALKQVPSCEYNPQEAIKTNVIGTMAVLSACAKSNIKKCMVVSTDKAVQPVNLYGATKLCAEKLAVAYNAMGSTSFSVVRYGNVLGSRGSVLELWKNQLDAGENITVTAPEMTRFWIAIEGAAAFVISCLERMTGGEIFVPKMYACSMKKLAQAATKGQGEIKIIPVRPGEKMHEVLVSNADAGNTTEHDDRYIIYPQYHEWTKKIPREGNPVDADFEYNTLIQSQNGKMAADETVLSQVCNF